jgi:hypothetical protein
MFTLLLSEKVGDFNQPAATTAPGYGSAYCALSECAPLRVARLWRKVN